MRIARLYLPKVSKMGKDEAGSLELDLALLEYNLKLVDLEDP